MAGFGESIDLVENIRSILHRYTFSVGIFRELLQNSDDAKATKQIFLLDHRTHNTGSLVDEGLAGLQGPALLAFNDAIFSHEDWKALQTISRSSKKTDTSKIGKYGLGIRACYHITDNLEVLSGDSLVVFDPQRNLLSDGGTRWQLTDLQEKCPDQLAPFSRFLPESSSSGFNGTIIRLPLRSSENKSELSSEVLEPSRIRQLLCRFIREELSIALLFLSHVTSIEVLEIDDEGERLLGMAEITREVPLKFGADVEQMHATTCTQVVKLSEGVFCQPESRTWRIMHASFSREQCAEVVAQELAYRDEYDVFAILDKEKLSPDISLAIPLLEPMTSGRLFTYLPLPLFTGFPCHVHALFALTDSRDHLRNGAEVGVLDHTRDKLLVAWNQVLFDTFIPRAWTTLLEALVGLDHVDNIYQAWPPAQHAAAGNEAAPWKHMPRSIIRIANERGSSIWPVVRAASHERLDSLLLATPQEEDMLLAALAHAGVRMAQPPAYIYDLLTDARWIATLSPRSAHSAILDGGQDFSNVSRAFKNLILSYLVSSSDQDLTFLAGLSMIPTVSGSDAVLYLRSESSPMIHTLLNREDSIIFGADDRPAIALHELPPVVAKELLQRGEKVLNVNVLTPSRIVDYLRAAFSRYGSSIDSSEVAPILSSFSEWLFTWWTWLSSWSQADELLTSVKAFPLLPTSRNGLRILHDGIYVLLDNFDPALHDILERCGIDFLHPSFPPAVLPYLRQKSLSKDPCRAFDLLQDFQPQAIRLLHDADIRKLGEHLSQSLSDMGRLKNIQMQQFCSLPIFPILERVENSEGYGIKHKLDTLPLGSTFHSISSASLLPTIPGSVFVVSDTYGLALLEHVDLKAATHALSEADVALLFVAHLTTQSPSVQLAFLKHLVGNPHLRTSHMDMKLQDTAFVAVEDKQGFLAPGDVIDPQSGISNLLRPDDRRPATDKLTTEIVSQLRALALLRTELTPKFVQERISRIAQLQDSSVRDASDLAHQLLGHLSSTSFNCNALVVNLDTVWLPTKQGLFSPQGCRDQRDRRLFDRILPVIELPAPINNSLRHALGWDRHVPIQVLQQQLEAVVLESNAERWRDLRSIIHELGQRLQELEPPQIEDLRHLTLDRPWIPISLTRIATTLQVVFSLNTTFGGFYQVPLDLLSHPGVKQFLELMGCTDTPSIAALLRQLHDLQEVQPTTDSVRRSIQIVNAIQVQPQACNYLPSILVPDVDGYLRKREDIFLDDLGVRARFMELPVDRFKLHAEASHHAAWLQIQSLTSLHLKGLDIDDEDMSEDLTTRISNVLRSYAKEQAFNEFLANAADAGATRFEMLLDEKHHQVTELKFLDPAMAKFCAGPALVIYNDRVFTDDDFRGIRRIGDGGKQGRDGVIGKFGLGALSVFHFTEFPMIVSGKDVLFLDPGMLYLPVDGDRKRNSLRIPLRHLRSLYGGHVALLDGLFGFSADVEHYDGTLFRLPLRTDEQSKKSRLSRFPRSVHSVVEMLSHYQMTLGLQSLIFVHVNDITISRRDSQGHRSPLWSCSVDRQDVHQEDSYSCQKLTCILGRLPQTRTEVYTVSRRLTIQDIPREIDTELVSKHRLKYVQIGLAASSTDHSKRRFFSTLPLPTFTSLPVHINATFALADDRRSIRFDDNGQSTAESKYNYWILSEQIPVLYFYLLERWPAELSNVGMWPRTAEDPLSRVVSESFYKSLASTPRQLCHSITARRLRPSDAVFGEEGAVVKALLTLKPSSLTLLPSDISETAMNAPVRRIDVEFLQTTLACDQSRFVSAYSDMDGEISVEDVVEVLRFFTGRSSLSFIGLPLLPLADGTLGTVGSSQDRSIYSGSWPLLDKPWSRLFPSDRFLHPRMEQHLLLNLGVNVTQLDGPAIIDLVQGRLPNSKVSKRSTTPAEHNWIDAFWSYFPHLGIDESEVASLALIPTTEPNQYISIDHWENSGIVVKYPTSRNLDDLLWIVPCLQRLGGIVVRKNPSYPESLKNVKKFSSPASIFKQTLGFLRKRDTARDALPTLWRERLSSSEKNKLAGWMREEVETNTGLFTQEKELIPVISHLPIWPAHRTRSVELRSAVDDGVKILPSDIELDRVKRFLEPHSFFAEFSPRVVTLLKLAPMSLSDFVRNLQLPRTLHASDVELYSWILGQMLALASRDPQLRHAPLKVPDASLTLTEPRKLYARSEPMFSAAFGPNPKYFPHPSYSTRGWEDFLVLYGLHRERNFAAFKECVTYLADDRARTGKVARAIQLFSWYKELPTHIGSQVTLWGELTSIRFIPRHTSRRRYSTMVIQPAEYILVLPELIAPSEVLRSKHERIAWTQRGLFHDDPDDRLFLADQSLGVPSTAEVVAHLCVLATEVAVDHSGNAEVLEDLLETYRWLSQQSDSAEELIRHRDEPLFLNVESASEPWHFTCASRLFLNTHDEGDHESVHRLLEPFKELLVAAGATEIKQPAAPTIPLTPAEEIFARWRIAMNDQRNHRILTDVVFVSAEAKEFPAHRTVLAASSEHFKGQFCGSWDAAGPATAENPIRIPVEDSSVAVGAVLEHIYAGTLGVPDRYDQEELISILGLSNCWQLTETHAEVQRALIRTITPLTYETLRERAEAFEAKMLLEACDNFERENYAVLCRFEK